MFPLFCGSRRGICRLRLLRQRHRRLQGARRQMERPLPVV